MTQTLPRLVNAGHDDQRAAAPAPHRISAVAENGRSRRGFTCLGNEAIEEAGSAIEQARIVAAAAQKLEELFDVLGVDHANDHNTRETPRRVAKMLVHEILRGRYAAPPELTEFDNAHGFDNLIVTGPIELRSTCAHHMLPIYGEVFVGVLPARDGKIIGLSKYDRIVDHFASRLQIQEELVKQIGNFIVEKTAPRGLAIRISAVHMCKTHRGVRSSHAGRMVNSAFYGELVGDHHLQSAFLQECLALSTA